jgi:site-specific recombinase XerD
MLLKDARPGFIDWLTSTKNLSSHTVRAYDGDVAALVRHVGLTFAVGDLSADVILGFLLDLRSQGLAESSLKRRFAGIRRFTHWLLLTTTVPSDPCHELAIRFARSRRLPRAVPPSDLHRLFSFLLETAGMSDRSVHSAATRPNELTTLFSTSLMVATGVRVSELTAIRLVDMDVLAGQIRIVGKGRRERTVYLPGVWLAELCVLYLQTREQVGVDHDRLLFNSVKDPLNPSAVRLRLAKACECANLSRKVTPHMLRHSAATQLLESGLDIRYVQRLLGHASITTTEIYTHVTDRALRQMIADANVLEALVQPA